MVGADVTMMCSALLRNGIEHLKLVKESVEEWMTAHENESVEQLKGSMSQRSCSDPSAFERANYMRALAGYHLKM